jgi:replicative DNA helicase
MTDSFDLIKQRVSLTDYFAQHLNCEIFPESGGRSSCLCPFHGEDTPSLRITESDRGWERWFCFGACQEGGTVIDAVMKQEGYSDPMDAAIHLNDLYGLDIDFDDPSFKARRERRARIRQEIDREREEMTNPESRVARRAFAYLHNRGYTDETIEYFQLGADAKTPAGRIGIPIFDRAGSPASVCYRALFDGSNCASCGEWVTTREIYKQNFQARRARDRGEEPQDWTACPHCGAADKESKLKFLITQWPKYDHMKGFDKSSFLYHGHGARRALNDKETGPGLTGLFLVEGPADSWAGWQAGEKAFCAYQGAVLSDKQAREAVSLVKDASHGDSKPIILVPDTDKAGESNIRKNIDKLRAVDPTIEIQVLHSVDTLTYVDENTGESKPCKDLGDIVKHHGHEKVLEVLSEQRWAAAEWEIRKIVNRRNPRTGRPYYTLETQMRHVAEVLQSIENKVALDHIIPEIASRWELGAERVQTWFHSRLSAENVASYSHLFKDAPQARLEAHEFSKEDNMIPTGYRKLDDALPGGGVRPGQLAQLLAKSGAGKTMLSTQLMMNWSEKDIPVIFFSLEQAAKSLYGRMVSQALDIDQETAMRYIDDNDPELDKCDHIFRNILIIDNVPTKDRPAISMTPSTVRAIVQEANLTEFKDRPTAVVVIDHLLIMEVDDDAPNDLKSSETMAPGYIMQKLFDVCKEMEVFLLMLQQLPGHVKQGVAPSSDDGWGSSKQLMFCDYVLTAWRPEQNADLDETERIEVSGQYKLMLAKNRYGANALAHLYFDKTSLRIIPALEVAQPADSGEANDGVIDMDAGTAMTISSEDDDAADESFIPTSQLRENLHEVFTEEGVESFVRANPEPISSDTKDLLLQSIGAIEDDEVEQQGNKSLMDWFES